MREDEEPIREAMVETLAREGHVVDAASDGLTGLARFQRGGFDVVLTDLSLPEELGARRRALGEAPAAGNPGRPDYRLGRLVDPTRLRGSGVDLMLVKPFRMEELLAVREDALRLRSAECSRR